MTLRLTEEQDLALTLLAQAEGVSPAQLDALLKAPALRSSGAFLDMGRS